MLPSWSLVAAFVAANSSHEEFDTSSSVAPAPHGGIPPSSYRDSARDSRNSDATVGATSTVEDECQDPSSGAANCSHSIVSQQEAPKSPVSNGTAPPLADEKSQKHSTTSQCLVESHNPRSTDARWTNSRSSDHKPSPTYVSNCSDEYSSFPSAPESAANSKASESPLSLRHAARCGSPDGCDGDNTASSWISSSPSSATDLDASEWNIVIGDEDRGGSSATRILDNGKHLAAAGLQDRSCGERYRQPNNGRFNWLFANPTEYLRLRTLLTLRDQKASKYSQHSRKPAIKAVYPALLQPIDLLGIELAELDLRWLARSYVMSKNQSLGRNGSWRESLATAARKRRAPDSHEEWYSEGLVPVVNLLTPTGTTRPARATKFCSTISKSTTAGNTRLLQPHVSRQFEARQHLLHPVASNSAPAVHPRRRCGTRGIFAANNQRRSQLRNWYQTSNRYTAYCLDGTMSEPLASRAELEAHIRTRAITALQSPASHQPSPLLPRSTPSESSPLSKSQRFCQPTVRGRPVQLGNTGSEAAQSSSSVAKRGTSDYSVASLATQQNEGDNSPILPIPPNFDDDIPALLTTLPAPRSFHTLLGWSSIVPARRQQRHVFDPSQIASMEWRHSS